MFNESVLQLVQRQINAELGESALVLDRGQGKLIRILALRGYTVHEIDSSTLLQKGRAIEVAKYNLIISHNSALSFWEDTFILHKIHETLSKHGHLVIVRTAIMSPNNQICASEHLRHDPKWEISTFVRNYDIDQTVENKVRTTIVIAKKHT